ncbi:hypothetical protein [Aurantimonas coralicida]|uniref:hypothetical protein n=1 Tax=Aurantimonas coralicida TaxID=182270 RepID=UPI001E33979A|nr:hypothetical protein [Aurantimonas coralicida]MCD1644145.1 hypothetical protein [Aurantimonas coralicida]
MRIHEIAEDEMARIDTWDFDGVDEISARYGALLALKALRDCSKDRCGDFFLAVEEDGTCSVKACIFEDMAEVGLAEIISQDSAWMNRHECSELATALRKAADQVDEIAKKKSR